MPFGKKIGPTGRKRDEFLVFSQGYKHYGRPRLSLTKAYKGNEGRYAWGVGGVKEAKRSVHKVHPHTWVKFSTYNETRNKKRKRG